MACATLGEAAASVEQDRQALRGSAHEVTDQDAYQVHALKLPSGTTLREFVAADGTVFAIAWRGPRTPDLKQTLGRYFDAYTAAAKARVGGGHSHVELRDKDFVVQAAGHMRAFTGRAYLTSAIPAGVSLGDIR
jgi:hypothetical protein